MEKENLNRNTGQTNIRQEKETTAIAGAAHLCCGKCRQRNELPTTSCDKRAERTDTSLTTNETMDDGKQTIIRTTK